MVMREDSCSESQGVVSQHCILDGHFLVVKIVMFVYKRPKRKEAGEGPFKNMLLLDHDHGLSIQLKNSKVSVGRFVL